MTEVSNNATADQDEEDDKHLPKKIIIKEHHSHNRDILAEEEEEKGTWTDVTSMFKQISSKMKLGEMAMSKDFTLYDSLSALELMAPKMDPGLKSDGYSSLVDKLKDNSFQKFPDSLDHILAVCLRLVRLEVSWLEGQSLLSTVLTSIMVYKPILSELAKTALDHLDSGKHFDEESLKRSIIYVFLASLLKNCELAHGTIVSADLYAEEDYSSYLGNLEFDFLPEIDESTSKVIQLLDLVIKEVKAKSHGNEIMNRILRTLKFRRAFLNQTVEFCRDELEGFKDANVWSRKALKAVEQLISEAVAFENITPDAEVDCFFDPFLSTDLLGPAPPKSVTVESLEGSLLVLKKFFEDSLILTDFLQCESLKQMYNFLSFFSQRQANILIRSRAVPALYTPRNFLALGKHHYADLIEDDMIDFGVRKEVFADGTAREVITNLLIRAIYDIFRLQLCNRSRFRRNCLNMLDTFKDVTVACEFVDKQIFVKKLQKWKEDNPNATEGTTPEVDYFDSFCSWCKVWSHNLVLEHILLGFELELYGPDEMIFVCWLVDFLIKAQVERRTRMEAFLTREVDSKFELLSEKFMKLNENSNSLPAKQMKKNRKDMAKELSKLRQKRETILRNLHKSKARRCNLETIAETDLIQDAIRLVHSGVLCIFIGIRIGANIKVQNIPEYNAAEEGATKLPLATIKQKFDLRFEKLKDKVPEYSLLEEGIVNNPFDLKTLLENAESKFSEAKALCQKHLVELKNHQPRHQTASLNDTKKEFFTQTMRISLQNLLVVKQNKEKLLQKSGICIKATIDSSNRTILPLLQLKIIEETN